MEGRKITINEGDVRFDFAKSGGAGGQNVNKRNTQAILYFNIPKSKLLTEEEKIILMCHGCSVTSNEILKKIWNRINANGDIIVSTSSERTQEANKERALGILNEEINEAIRISKPREVKLPKRVLAARRAQGRSAQVHKYKQRRVLRDY